MTILLHSIIISAWCLGFRTITDDGQILSFLRDWARITYEFRYDAWSQSSRNLNLFPNFKYCLFLLAKGLLKPLILCVTCTASIHGFILYSLMWGIEWQMIISIVFAAFLNMVCWLLTEKYVL